MARTLPYQCKFIWGSKDLEDELKRIAEKISQDRMLRINMSALTHQLAMDLKTNKIVLDPITIRFHSQNVMVIDDNKKLKLKRFENVTI